MDILTTEDQQYFYDHNVDALTEDFENSSVHTRQPEIAETVMLEKFIKIDGVRYAFRHLIKGYKSNSIQNILSISKSSQIPVLHIERANNTQINQFYKDGNNINNMLDDESNSSLEEETIPSLIDDIKMISLENDLMFNLNYGVSFLTPPNFVVRKDEVKLDLKSIFKPHLPGEKDLVKKHFAGWYSKLYFDNLKRPDKAIVKKYANPDQISSTGRDRSISPHGSLQKSKTKNISILSSEVVSEMTSMQETFEKYKSDHLENKLIWIEKYYNFQEIIDSFNINNVISNNPSSDILKIETIVLPEHYPANSKLKLIKDKNIRVRKLRGINKEYFNWIKDNLLFNLIRVYIWNSKEYCSHRSTPKSQRCVIHQLSNNNFIRESQRMIYLWNELHPLWIGYIEHPQIPVANNYLENYNISLFDPPYLSIFSWLK